MNPMNYYRLPRSIPPIIPAGWVEIPSFNPVSRTFIRAMPHLAVIIGEERHSRDWWIHLSISHRDRIPIWDEIKEAKELFIGKDRKAIQVLPAEEHYYNQHPYTLHLWSCLGADALPEFTKLAEKVVGARGI
jgi:hypothetical protein